MKEHERLAAAIQTQARAEGKALCTVERELGLGGGTLYRFCQGERWLGRKMCRRVEGWLGWTEAAIWQASEGLRREITGERRKSIALVEVQETDLPCLTLAGTMHRLPVSSWGGMRDVRGAGRVPGDGGGGRLCAVRADDRGGRACC